MPDKPRPQEFAALPSFDDAKYYTVHLYRAVEWGGRTFSPAATLTLRGDIAKEIAAAIFTAEEASEP